VGPLGCINRVACGPKLSCSTSAFLVVWSGLLWPSVWPIVHTTWSPVSESIISSPTLPLHPPHPLISGIHDISGSVQNISQNQPVHPVAIQVSVMIAIYIPTLLLLQILRGYYQAKGVYNIFYISNLYFSKSSDVCMWMVFQNWVTYGVIDVPMHFSQFFHIKPTLKWILDTSKLQMPFWVNPYY